nr:class I SAM-dependent methyltransferase [Candidatus Njordarchaeota archaeon]
MSGRRITEYHSDEESSDEAVREHWHTRDPSDFESVVKTSGRLEALKIVAEWARPYVSRQDAVSIDLGCGTGLFEEIVRCRNIVGVDFSPPFLQLARKRMTIVIERDIFDLRCQDGIADNIVSLFVIDDYKPGKKVEFFKEVYRLLRRRGRFFFGAYSPRDERMGTLRSEFNEKMRIKKFSIFLEDASSYEDKLRKCGFLIDRSEVIKSVGSCQPPIIAEPPITVKREFILIVGRKP